jgi:hypothetical protein
MAQGPSDFYSRYRGPMTDRAEYEDPIGGQSMMGGDAFSQAVIEDMLLGRGDQYSPGGVQAPPMFPEEQPDPQDFIRQQLAGDVVPIYQNMNRDQMMQLRDRIQNPAIGQYQGSRGAASINQFGGKQSPYLDLMDVLMMRPRGQ